MSEITKVLEKGITAHALKAVIKVIIGANKNKKVLELVGIIISSKITLHHRQVVAVIRKDQQHLGLF